MTIRSLKYFSLYNILSVLVRVIVIFSARQLAYARPDTYGSNLPPWMAAKFPELALLVHHKRPKVTGVSSVAKLQSTQGQLFVHFSKSADFGKGESQLRRDNSRDRK